jgi:hypothetical protein
MGGVVVGDCSCAIAAVKAVQMIPSESNVRFIVLIRLFDAK